MATDDGRDERTEGERGDDADERVGRGCCEVYSRDMRVMGEGHWSDTFDDEMRVMGEGRGSVFVSTARDVGRLLAVSVV